MGQKKSKKNKNRKRNPNKHLAKMLGKDEKPEEKKDIYKTADLFDMKALEENLQETRKNKHRASGKVAALDLRAKMLTEKLVDPQVKSDAVRNNIQKLLIRCQEERTRMVTTVFEIDGIVAEMLDFIGSLKELIAEEEKPEGKKEETPIVPIATEEDIEPPNDEENGDGRSNGNEYNNGDSGQGSN